MRYPDAARANFTQGRQLGSLCGKTNCIVASLPPAGAVIAHPVLLKTREAR